MIAEDHYFSLQGYVEFCAFGVMILILIVCWVSILRQLSNSFGDAMKEERKIMKIMYTIFTLFLLLQTLYAFFSGKFFNVICRTASRWFWQDTLTMLWDFPPILAINFLHRQNTKTTDTVSRDQIQNYSADSNHLMVDSEQRCSEVIEVEVDSSFATVEEAPEKLTNIELYQRYATAGEYAAIINKFRSKGSFSSSFKISLMES